MKKNTVQKDLPLGLYIHIPFCRSKCAYCDFYSLAGAEERMDDYCRALERHLAEVAPQAECHKADTVYFGGGTPSYLGAERSAVCWAASGNYIRWTSTRRSLWRQIPTPPRTERP